MKKGTHGLDLTLFKGANCPVHKDRQVTLLRCRLLKTGVFVNRYFCSECGNLYEQPLWVEIRPQKKQEEHHGKE